MNANWCNHSGKLSRRFLKKLKIELHYYPAIALLGIYLPIVYKKYRYEMVHAALSTIAKLRREPKFLSTDDWIKKMRYTILYAYRYIYDVLI